jgi:transcriptional regulator with XRE-family HTH domain
MNIGGQMTEDTQFTKLTADLIMVAKGFCEYGQDKGLLTPDGLRFAISNRQELARQLNQAGISQGKIAALLGVSQQTISYDLNGRPPQSGKELPQSGDPETFEADEDELEDGWHDANPDLDEADEPEEDIKPDHYRAAYSMRCADALAYAKDCESIVKGLRESVKRLRGKDDLTSMARTTADAWNQLVKLMEDEL